MSIQRGRVLDRPDVFDVDALDLAELAGQQWDERLVGELNDQLVDGPTGASLENVDADEVAADGADPAGNRTERARAIRKPDADDVDGHRGG